MADSENSEIHLQEQEHHKQYELCQTRPAYRQGRKLTAVKVYTVNSESQHLFIYSVPKINLRIELKNLCIKYGKVVSIHVVADQPTEAFTECYHVQYERIQSARIAKRLLDNKSFYGGILHVCYAPEYESVEEARAKLQQRSKDVISRTNEDYKALINSNADKNIKLEQFANITKSQIKKKRKQDYAFQIDETISKGDCYNNASTSSKRFKNS